MPHLKHHVSLRNLTTTFFLLSLIVGLPEIRARQSERLFPYGLDEKDAALPRDSDDISSPEFRLSVPIVLYGQQFNSVYINQNGLISFQTEFPSFVNVQFPLEFPVIAALYSDVDTRIVGAIYYRESKESAILETARTILAQHFTSAQGFRPNAALIVTWDSVGNFDRKSDKTNTFQLVIGTDGRDSYVLFLYDKIEWIQGTGKNPSLPDAKAQAGIISGNGPFFSLKGSGTDQVSNLHKRSNLGDEGIWAFRIGNAGDTVEEPDLNVGQDATSEASASCAIGSTSCHSQSECVDYSPGFCCKCSRGFYGNGRTCLQDAIPQRVTGKVKGVLNGIAIEDADLFSYIIPADGRAYTAIAKIPDRLGYDLQTLSVIGTIIGWLFSISIKDAPNGFQLTGGIFNYTAEVVFQQTGQKVSIHQTYSGLDVFSHLKVDTRIHGTTAIIPVGTTIEVNDYEMLMTRVSAGIIRSKSSHNYRVEGTSTDNPFTIEQTVTYEECPWASPVSADLETTKMKVGRNYIIYDAAQQIARYAITSKVTPPDGVDQCKENKDRCGPNSSCVATDDSFKCICNLGYEELYAQEGQNADIPECVDIDECRIGTSTCDVTAICHNQEGSYSCECRKEDGYTGDGYTCSKILSCTDVQCGNNAQCVEANVGEPVCQCLTGFYGDGLFCIPLTGSEIRPGTTPDCRSVDICDPSADCIFSHASNSYICSCRRGYTGDGIRCTVETENEREQAPDCRSYNICDPFAECLFDQRSNTYGCSCRNGYTGDGRRCIQDQTGSGSVQIPVPERPIDCREGNVCDPFADCTYNRPSNSFECVCKQGFSGDGIRCMEEGVETCDIENNCDRHADCKFDEHVHDYACVCRQADGFFGDGLTCARSAAAGENSQLNPEPTCSFGTFNEQCHCPSEFKYDDIRRQCLQDTQETTCEVDRSICDYNAQCTPQQGGAYSCVCNPGYSGDGRQCLPQDLCTSHAQCSQYGECTYNRTDLRYSCKCREGFEGDGTDCRATADAGCDVLRNCDTNGRCVWNAGRSKYVCECGAGWIGDGLRCQEDLTGCNILNNCARNAECSFDTQARGYRCHCKQGYEGDGQICRSTVPCYQDRNVCDPNAECAPNQETREWKCQCNQGYNGDGYTCFEAGRIDSQLLFVTKGMSIIKVPLGGEKPYPMTLEPFQTAIGIDYDCPNQIVYWSDVAGKFIKQASINGSGKMTFLNANIGSPEGLSLDWASENLYWTDSSKDTIEVANLKTKKRKILFSTELVNPRGIAVYPQRGRLYWSDWNRQNPIIEFSGLDGIGRQTLIGEGLALPNSLIIDALADQLCWADAGTHKIECVGIDGRNRRSFVNDVKYPFGLALTRDTFYWSDWETKSIQSASRNSGVLGQSIEVPLGGPGKLYGVVLVPTTCPQVYSPCANSQCPEEHICLPNIRGGRTCRCTDAAGPNCSDSA